MERHLRSSRSRPRAILARCDAQVLHRQVLLRRQRQHPSCEQCLSASPRMGLEERTSETVLPSGSVLSCHFFLSVLMLHSFLSFFPSALPLPTCVVLLSSILRTTHSSTLKGRKLSAHDDGVWWPRLNASELFHNFFCLEPNTRFFFFFLFGASSGAAGFSALEKTRLFARLGLKPLDGAVGCRRNSALVSSPSFLFLDSRIGKRLAKDVARW